MSSLKWVIGVPVAIVVVVFLKVSMPPDAPQKPRQYNPDQSSITPPDNNGRSTYIPPENTGISEKAKFENAATACWNEYGRKSLSDSEKRQIAFMCEGLDKRAAETR